MRIRGGSRRRILGNNGGPRKCVRRRKLTASSAHALVLRLLGPLHKYSQSRQFYNLGYAFFFSPLKLLGNGSFVLANFGKRSAFHGLSLLYAGITFFRFVELIGHVSTEGMDMTGTLCLLYWIAMFACGCLSYGVCIYEDMLQVLNHSHPGCMRQVCGFEEGPFCSLIFWLMRMMAFYIISSCTLTAALFSLVSDSIPGCVYPTLKGLLPDWEIPGTAWQIALLPVEALTVVPVSAPAFISAYTLLIAITQNKDNVSKLRRKKISNLKDWRRVESGYRTAMVYNEIFIKWAKRVTPPILIGILLGLIGTIYVSLTAYERLPFYIYALFPVGAMLVMATFTIVSMDTVGLKRNADDVLGSLRERPAFYGSLSADERKELILRGRALRPVTIPIGEFTEMSMDVPVYVFEEAMDQILFLISL